LGAPIAPVLSLVGPLVGFLGGALTLAALAGRSGLTERAALVLAARAGGRADVLYALVCALCALLTATVSLDGAVVLMLPVLQGLTRRWGAPFRPLFLGIVVVANTASVAVAQGNPTNLVVIERLGISPAHFTLTMLGPGLAAATLGAIAIAVGERRRLGGGYRVPRSRAGPWSAAERWAAASLACAAAVAWISPLVGLAPWWPFAGVAALALLPGRERLRPRLPWRVAAQVTALVVVVGALPLHVRPSPSPGLAALAMIALGVCAVAAVANNLPASVCAAALLARGSSAYAASIGLSVGSLATPQGSVATLIATDLAGLAAPRLPMRTLAAIAVVGVLVGTALVWLGVG
jgi:arsenical pump membrane protein